MGIKNNKWNDVFVLFWHNFVENLEFVIFLIPISQYQTRKLNTHQATISANFIIFAFDIDGCCLGGGGDGGFYWFVLLRLLLALLSSVNFI